MIELSPTQCRALRATAHGLQPVVSISAKGLIDPVMQEIDTCLKAHELVKIRVYGDGDGASARREEYLAAICRQLGCAPVQHIGKLLVVWRPAPAAALSAKAPVRRAAPGKTGRGTKRSMQGNTPK